MPRDITNSGVNPNYTENKVKQVVGEEAARAAVKSRLPGETNAERMARITQAYKNQYQPTLNQAQIDAGATVQFVRTGPTGQGEYKIVYPIGVAYDKVTGQPLKNPNANASNPKTQPLPTGSYKILKKVANPGGDGVLVTYQNTDTGETIDKVEYPNSMDGAGGSTTVADTTLSDAKKQQRVSAYNTLYNEFNKYGLGSLVSDIKNYLIDNTFDPSEFSIQLQNTDAYKKRFAANQDRINKGLAALTPAQYINLEDQYQEIMRRYGLPASYYQKGDLGIQEGFNKLIANDVSATELEDRVMTAQNRLINTDVNTLDALRKFYPNITNGDLLAYTLDPTNAINDIKRKATAAEIGGAALGQGLVADVNTAEALAKAGINKAQALQGYSTIGEILPRASSLADIYAAQGLGPYNQTTAESEVFNTGAAADAARKRKKLSELERATFSGQSGASSNALNRDRASAYQGFVSSGAGAF